MKRKKQTGTLLCLMFIAALALMVAGCGGGSSSTAAGGGTTTTSSDDYTVYGTTVAGREAGREAYQGAASGTIVVLPSGTTPPAGYEAVSGASVQFTDSSGNVVTMTTDANGKFNPNNLGTSSSDAAKGLAILQGAQTDVSQQPTITVVPPATGKFKDVPPANADVSLAPTPAAATEIVSLKVVPDVKKVLTGAKVLLNALALDANGLVTRPPLTVTWTIAGTGATAGDLSVPTDKKFICIYTPAAASKGQTVTITATTQTSSGTGATSVSAVAKLDVIDASTLFTVTGTVKSTTGAAWGNAVVNFAVPPTASGTPPIHIPVKANASGAYRAVLPPGATFTVFIGSPFVEGATTPPSISISNPAAYMAGAASATGTQDFQATAVTFKPPPPPPPIEKYVMGAFWGLRDTMDKSVVDPDTGILDIILIATATTGIGAEPPYKGWPWAKTVSGTTNTWTITEPATGTFVPHHKLVITSTATGTYGFTLYVNRAGDVRQASGTVIFQAGDWTMTYTGTLPEPTTASFNSTVKFYAPDKQTAPQRIVIQIITHTKATNATRIQNTFKTGDGLRIVGSSDVTKTWSNCADPCDRVTFTSPAGGIVQRVYMADGTTYKDLLTTLAGAIKTPGNAGTFTLTNATTGDPQLGAKVVFYLPGQPTTPTPEPPPRTGEVWGYEAATTDANRQLKLVATFTIDFRNICTMKKFPGTANEVITSFQI